jgi:hypothetical protein
VLVLGGDGLLSENDRSEWLETSAVMLGQKSRPRTQGEGARVSWKRYPAGGAEDASPAATCAVHDMVRAVIGRIENTRQESWGRGAR